MPEAGRRLSPCASGRAEDAIVNNCSADRNLEMQYRRKPRDHQELRGKVPRIRISNRETFACVEQTRDAFRQASPGSIYGKVVAADDWLTPECLSKVVAADDWLTPECLNKWSDLVVKSRSRATELVHRLQIGDDRPAGRTVRNSAISHRRSWSK